MASGGYDGTLVEADAYHEDSFGDEDGDGAMFVAFGFEFTSLALSVAVAMILVFLILSVLSIWYTCWVCRGHRMCGCSGLKEGGGGSFDGLPPVRTFSGETSSSAGGSRERSGSHAGSRSSCRSGPSGGLNRIAPARRAGGQVLGGGWPISRWEQAAEVPSPPPPPPPRQGPLPPPPSLAPSGGTRREDSSGSEASVVVDFSGVWSA